MTSVERVVEYIELPSEPLYKGVAAKPSNDWPQKGRIEFENVSLRYDEHLPRAIKDLSLEIRPGEKVGIIGRTGAGKSSFIQTLFRLFDYDCGCIRIDNVDIKKLSLYDLRSRLTIIPVSDFNFNKDMFKT